MTLARKGSKGWMSEESKGNSINLPGKKSSLKQNSWDAIRVWWAPTLTQGKLHVEILGTEFPGETAAGAVLLAAAVRKALNIRYLSIASDMYLKNAKLLLGGPNVLLYDV